MSGSTSFLIYVAFFLTCLSAGAPDFASAGQWSDKCEKAGKKSEAACKAASDGAKATDTAQANGNIAGVGSSSNVNPGAGALQQQAKDQASRLTNAKNKCEEEKEKCEQECDQEEQKRQSKENLPDDPIKGPPPIKVEAKQDKGPLKEKKQSACIAPIMAIMGPLGAGAADAAKAAGDSAKTGGSSGGMPPMPPMSPPGGGDKKEDAAKDEAAKVAPIACETEGYSKYSDCNSHYISKCESAMNSPTCEPFIARYCGNYSATPSTPAAGNDSLSLSTQSAAATAATANLVANKQGEGLGSAFCQKVTAYRFCQMAGRSQCPSCKNQNSAWASNTNAGQLADAQKTCPTDPVFLDPAVLAQVNGATGLGTSTPATDATTKSAVDRVSSLSTGSAANGGGGAGGFGAGAGGAGSTAGNPTGGATPGYSGPSLAEGSGFGGGGGGGYGGGASDAEGSASGPGYAPKSVNGQARRAPTSLAAQGGPKDVAVQYGPSVFSIQSTAYRDLCAKGRFLHCRR